MCVVGGDGVCGPRKHSVLRQKDVGVLLSEVEVRTREVHADLLGDCSGHLDHAVVLDAVSAHERDALAVADFLGLVGQERAFRVEDGVEEDVRVTMTDRGQHRMEVRVTDLDRFVGGDLPGAA